jgi:hypothetical protein
MNMKCTFFDGNTITVSEGTHRPEDLVYAIIHVLEDYYGEFASSYDDTRDVLAELIYEDERYEIEDLLSDFTEELEALAELHGYYFGTTEGDGAHYVLAPVVGPEGL